MDDDGWERGLIRPLWQIWRRPKYMPSKRQEPLVIAQTVAKFHAYPGHLPATSHGQLQGPARLSPSISYSGFDEAGKRF